jgi:hypothetical protein
MEELTPERILDVQRRWMRNRFLGDVWLLAYTVAALVYMMPASQKWILQLIAPMPPLVLLAGAVVLAWWPISRFTRCPACCRNVVGLRRATFCPNCGVRLRERADT